MREDNRDGTTAARTALNMEARGMEASRVRSGHGRQPSESQEVADVFSASFRTHVGAEPAFQGQIRREARIGELAPVSLQPAYRRSRPRCGPGGRSPPGGCGG